METLTLDAVRQTFGAQVYTHASEYYENSRVFNFKVLDKRITSCVADSQAESYTVEIAVDQGAIRYSCDCPDNQLCKHQAAVLIKYIRESVNNGQTDALQLASRRLENRKQKNIILRKSKSNRYLSGQISHAFTGYREPRQEQKRYKLIFILEFGSCYLLKPALSRVKQDGALGHIESFSYHKLTEPVSREAQLILKNLLSSNLEMSKLLFTIDLLPEGSLPVYYENSRQPVTLRRFDKIAVNFLVHTVYNDDEISFFPCLGLLDEAGNQIKSIAGQEEMTLTGECFCVYNRNEALLAYTLDNDLIGLLELMTAGCPEYFAADIENLKASLPPAMGGKVTVHFNYTAVSIENQQPFAIVLLSRKKERLCARLHFLYQHTLLAFEDNREYLVDMTRPETGILYLLARAHEYEQAVYDTLAGLFDAYGENPFTSLPGAVECSTDFFFALSPFDFIVKFGDLLHERGIEIKVDNKRVITGGARVAFRVQETMDWFDVRGFLRFDDCREGREFPLVIDPNLLKKGLINLGDSYVMISKEDLRLIREMLAAGMEADSVLKVSKLNFSLIDQVYQRALHEEQLSLTSQEILSRFKDFSAIESKPLPTGFRGCLRNYQAAGYNWLNFMHDYRLGGCLADDMGLGKTIQTLALIQGLKERQQAEFATCLLVLPVVTLSNWETEISQFTPQLRFYRHAGSRRIKNIEELLSYDLVLISYHTLKNDIDLFTLCRFYYIILDEAQYIKNAASQVFRAIRSLKAHYRLSLTGTPIENSTMELWSQMKFLNPALFGSSREFRQAYAQPIEGKDDKEAAQRLRRLVLPFILRRKKEDVLEDLPDKEEITYYCEMKEEQQDLYNQVREYYRAQLLAVIEQKGYTRSSLEIFDSMLKLRQLALFPQLANSEYAGIPSCKFAALQKILEEIIREDHKILIFSQFVQVLQIIRKWCDKAGFTYAFLSGATSNRQEQIRKFQEQQDVRIFLLSLKAGGVGINLTAADYVVLFDPWWNPAAEKQAIDRCYRLGQQRKVIAYKMIVRHSIEEKILSLQQRKQALAGELITEEIGLLKTLGPDDVLSLFE